MILVFFRPTLQPFSALALILISLTDIWEPKLAGGRFSPTRIGVRTPYGGRLSLEDIIAQQLPVPHREMLPITLEEQLIALRINSFLKPIWMKRKQWRKHGKVLQNMVKKV